MARKLVVEIVGDSSSLDRAFRRSEKSAAKFGRDVSKATRGAAAGSGVFRGLGRSVAFASGGFLAFESGAAFIRSSIDAAREAAVSQRSLAAQMRVSGESFQANREQIEKAANSYGKFGFDNDKVIQSLTILERGTGSITKSLRMEMGVADVARGTHKSLAVASLAVAKAFSGQETALRRLVPGLPKAAHGAALAQAAFAKMAGQAAANTTQTESFGAALHNTEEIIGTALLPTMDKFQGFLTTWLNNTKNQEKLQRVANTTARRGATAFGLLAAAIDKSAAAYGKYQQLLKATGQKRGLAGDILRFGESQVPGLQKVLDAWNQVHKAVRGNKAITGGAGVEAFLQGIRQDAIPAGKPGGPRGRRPLGLAGRFNLAELKLAQAQLTKTQADDRRILVVEQAIVEQQIKQAKSLKDRIRLTQQLGGIVGQIRGIDQQAADAIKQQTQNRKDAAQAVAEAAKAAREAAKARLSAKLQTGLDWLDFGLEKAQASKKVGDDVKAEKKIIAHLKDMVRQTGLTVDLARQIFEHRQALADLLKQKGGKQKTLGQAGFQFQGLAPGVLPAMLRPGGIPPPAALAVGGRAGIPPPLTVGTMNVHLHGVQDVKALELELQKRAGQRPHPRRGN